MAMTTYQATTTTTTATPGAPIGGANKASDMAAPDLATTVVCDLVFPPAGVALATGDGIETATNFLLTALGWFPGVIHAFIVTMSPKTRLSKMCRTTVPAVLPAAHAPYGGVSSSSTAGPQQVYGANQPYAAPGSTAPQKALTNAPAAAGTAGNPQPYVAPGAATTSSSYGTAPVPSAAAKQAAAPPYTYEAR